MGIYLHDLAPSLGATRARKRVGRGHGSGTHKTSGKGTKGQKARTGHHGLPKPGFEGGQSSIARRLPKRGFVNIFNDKPHIVNIGELCRVFPSLNKIGIEEIKAAKLIPHQAKQVKVLSVGWESLTKGVEIQAHCFSKQAKEKILEAGGKAVSIVLEKNRLSY